MLPDLIKIVRRGPTAQVWIDGEPIPWPVARAGTVHTVDCDDVPAVTLTLVAKRVVIENDLERSPEGV